jgi:CPA2 family monovalent cation:H+ antiporter-2
MSTMEEIEIQEQLIREDLYAQLSANDHAWESADLKKEQEEGLQVSKE